jgi:hypothetical protein
VRAKQKAKESEALANPQKTPEAIKKRSMLDRLRPIASSLLLHVNTNGKSVITVPEAIAHLQLSFPNFYLNSGISFIITLTSIDQIYDHLKLLAETVPSFCSLEVLVSAAHLKQHNAQHYLIRFHQNRISLVAKAMEQIKT